VEIGEVKGLKFWEVCSREKVQNSGWDLCLESRIMTKFDNVVWTAYEACRATWELDNNSAFIPRPNKIMESLG